MHINSPLTSPSPLAAESESCKAVIFTIAGHLLALPVSAIERVMTTPTLLNINSSGLSLMHLSLQDDAIGASSRVELARRPLTGFDITVLDLYPHLSTVPPTGLHQAKSKNKGRFLIVTHSQQGMLGILVDEPPTIMELPLSAIRAFPRACRQATPLGIANHIAVLPQEVGNLTKSMQSSLTPSGRTLRIFLLNMSQLLKMLPGRSSPQEAL
ncbi:MAG: hypothetical protein JOZ78_21750 [Chroococcidiopsidaceae cyanobacterium CP_BM_ER_R8_30]|nr:hypothetical protein [Chroococcidiopsidaceae cyanobacterium CP_BM_ER_R8_30]